MSCLFRLPMSFWIFQKPKKNQETKGHLDFWYLGDVWLLKGLKTNSLKVAES